MSVRQVNPNRVYAHNHIVKNIRDFNANIRADDFGIKREKG